MFAAGALFAPLVSLGSPAFAVGEADPPPPRDITELCQNVDENDNPFEDIDGNTFEQNIICLAFAEITRGTNPEGTRYSPGQAVIRGQMASFIARLIDTANGLDTGDNIQELPAFDGDEQFVDVAPGYTHREAIARLADAGIVEGGPGGRPSNVYGPQLEVTRAQMASFIIRALEYMTGDSFDTALDFFVDDENAQPHEPNINAVAAEAIAVGDGEDQYNPFQSVSRGQMSAFLTRTLAVLFDDGDIRALGEEEPQPGPDVIVETEEVVAGEQIRFTIDADNIASVQVSGDCVDTTTFEVDADNSEDGFQVEIPTNEDAAAGTCTIDLVITDEDGVESEASFDVEIVEAQAPDVTVDDSTLRAGEPINFTVAGDDIDSVVVSGDCVDNTTRQDDADAMRAGFQVSVPTRNNATAGQCTINLVITDNDGDEFTDSFTVTIEQVSGATTRPELVSANIVGTVQPGNATPSNPQGTTVTYTFDENVVVTQDTGGSSNPNGVDITRFNVYNADGANVSGTREFVSASGNTVTIRFRDITTTTGTGTDNASRLTLATVDVEAVFDTQGQANTEGDAAIGTSGGGSTQQPAGITVAPDLVSVGNFRQAATVGQTAVDFTFDEAAFVAGATPDDFRLVLQDGRDIGADRIPSGNNPSGGTIAGGNGTTTFTVIFVNPDGPDDGNTPGQSTDPQLNSGTATDASSVARGTIESDTVSDASTGGNLNVLQAADAGNGGNSVEPDLVSVELRPNATTTGADQALFTFDEPVVASSPTNDAEGTSPDASSFRLYQTDGTELEGTATSVNTAGDRRQVLVTFANNANGSSGNTTATDNAVGGSIEDGAVAAANADGSPRGTLGNRVFNEQDEAGVANTATIPAQTPGRTADPDLTGVTLSQRTDEFGNAREFRATYTFDEAVTTTVTSGEFFLYLADGTRLTGTACTTGTTTSGAGQNNNTVTCTQFDGVDPTNAQQSARVGSAVLGTVDDGAVRALDNGDTNPEGAEFTTGGTGTRRQ